MTATTISRPTATSSSLHSAHLSPAALSLSCSVRSCTVPWPSAPQLAFAPDRDRDACAWTVLASHHEAVRRLGPRTLEVQKLLLFELSPRAMRASSSSRSTTSSRSRVAMRRRAPRGTLSRRLETVRFRRRAGGGFSHLGLRLFEADCRSSSARARTPYGPFLQRRRKSKRRLFFRSR